MPRMIANNMAPDDRVVDEKFSKEVSRPNEPSGRPSAENDTERGYPSLGPQKRSSLFEAQLRKHGMQATKHLNAEVTTDHADALMLLCCLISGFIDSTIYYAYGTFVSMQTGNTIFIGLGGSTGHTTNKPYGWAKSLISVVCFVLGSLFFSRFHRFLTPLRRSTLVASFLLQTMVVLITAALIQAEVIDGALATIPSDIDWRQALPIALLSFQSAGQIVASRALSLSEIPSVVITSVVCDLVSDPQLLAGLPSNVKRNRRILAFFGILAGAVAGGWLTSKTGKIQGALWVAGGLKLMVTAAWSTWPKKSSESRQ